jgi:hypothetical protein
MGSCLVKCGRLGDIFEMSLLPSGIRRERYVRMLLCGIRVTNNLGSPGVNPYVEQNVICFFLTNA